MPKHLTIEQRTALLVREDLAPLLREAGFRRTRHIFRRRHGGLQQILQIYAHTTVFGGKSPPRGTLYMWIGFDPRPRAQLLESQCAVHCQPPHLIEARAGWPVPPRTGPERKRIAAGIQRELRALIVALDAITSDEELRAALQARAATR